MTDESVAKLVDGLHRVCRKVIGHEAKDDSHCEIHKAAAAIIMLSEDLRSAHRIALEGNPVFTDMRNELASLREDWERFMPVVSFLLGEKALDGAWFGERRLGRPQYWWRAHLRAALRAAKERSGE